MLPAASRASSSTWRTKTSCAESPATRTTTCAIPDRDPIEKAIALGMMGTVSLNGPLSKTAALKRYGGEKIAP